VKRGKLKRAVIREHLPDDFIPSVTAPTVRLNWEHAFVDHGYPTRLRVGDVFDHQYGELVVAKVSDCGAVCVPSTLKQVNYNTLAGKAVRFTTTGEVTRVCANSEVHIKYRLGLVGLRQLLGEEVAETPRQNVTSPMKRK
jgi:hypothetical protein